MLTHFVQVTFKRLSSPVLVVAEDSSQLSVIKLNGSTQAPPTSELAFPVSHEGHLPPTRATGQAVPQTPSTRVPELQFVHQGLS